MTNADRAQDMHPSDVEAVLDERDELRRRLAIIRAEYERMKHNDDVLTQHYAESTAWMVAMDLWRAIKAAAEPVNNRRTS
jgi:hypothetical protein